MISNHLLLKLRNDVHATISEAKEFELLPDSILNWKHSDGKWSILECVEHLNRYSVYYNAELKKAIVHARPSDNNKHEAESTWLGRKFIAMMHPDNTAKHKTFTRMNPIHSSLSKEVLVTFLRNQEDLLDILHDASRVDLNKTSVRVEFLKIIKMNIGDALQFVIVHQQRHMKQARAVRMDAEALLTPLLKV